MNLSRNNCAKMRQKKTIARNRIYNIGADCALFSLGRFSQLNLAMEELCAVNTFVSYAALVTAVELCFFFLLLLQISEFMSINCLKVIFCNKELKQINNINECN